MNINGVSPEASKNLYKTFIRPIMEYGLQLGVLKKNQIVSAQKVQNLALRCIFSAQRNTSINAMHKLLQIESMELRNKILNMKYMAKLNESNDLSIPAVAVYKFIKTFSPKIFLKNPLLQSGEPISDKTKITKIIQKELMDTNANESNIAGAILYKRNDKLRHFITAKSKVPRKIRIALTRWTLGQIARHDPCYTCGQEINRQHALECSNGYNMIFDLKEKEKRRKEEKKNMKKRKKKDKKEKKRIEKNENEPIVVDINDRISIFNNWNTKRQSFYKQKKFNIKFEDSSESPDICLEECLIRS